MIGILVALLLSPPAEYAGPIRGATLPPPGAVVVRTEYLLIGKDGRPVRVGLDEWSERRK
jgi:hypothetical protein